MKNNKKLSAFDIGKIKEYYEDTNDNESLIEIFKILKRRLTTEDYKKIQEISSSFLDIQEINKRIKIIRINILNESML